MATDIVECRGKKRIEQLRMHDDSKVCSMAVKLLEMYFGAENEEGDGVEPIEAEGGSKFVFGQPANTAADGTVGVQPAQGGFNIGRASAKHRRRRPVPR